jgi:hypothetical protein
MNQKPQQNENEPGATAERGGTETTTERRPEATAERR